MVTREIHCLVSFLLPPPSIMVTGQSPDMEAQIQFPLLVKELDRKFIFHGGGWGGGMAWWSVKKITNYFLKLQSLYN